jgi:aldehyde:ferredoxin oxidoreductase
MTEYKGYTGKILRVDLSTGEIEDVSTDMYADRFIGGRGVAAKVHWNEVPPQTDAFDPENRLCIMTGPFCGVPGIAASRWQVSAKSPLHNTFSYCNLGGSWGAQLKFAGIDGLIFQGKSDKLVYIVIDDDKIEFKDASPLKGLGAIQTRERLKEAYGKSLRVVAVGAAGENMVHFATLTADADSSGASGIGAVFGSKNLKAVCVRGSGKVEVADKDRLSELRKTIRSIKPEHLDWPSMLPQEQFKKQLCFGCIDGCMRQTFTTQSGETGKYMCQSAIFYEVRGQRFHGEVTEVSYMANKLCDDYGVDTRAVETMIMWLSRCLRAGILTDENTGIPLSKMGSLEFIDTLLNKLSLRDGIGDALAQGTIKAAGIVGRDSAQFIKDYMIDTGENEIYGPRLYITTGLLYAFEPRMPIQQLHEISIPAMGWAAREVGYMDNYLTSDVLRGIGARFWGSEIAADFSTYEAKAEAAVRIQNRQYAKEALIVCDFTWPILYSPTTPDHIGDPSLESQLTTAITGIEIDEPGLYKVGERLFNLQRAILVRESRKRREHDTLAEFCFSAPLKGDYGNPECLVPGKDGEAFSRKGMVVERDTFEKMKDEFYEIRGWDVATGLQTKPQLDALALTDIAEVLAGEGLLAD